MLEIRRPSSPGAAHRRAPRGGKTRCRGAGPPTPSSWSVSAALLGLPTHGARGTASRLNWSASDLLDFLLADVVAVAAWSLRSCRPFAWPLPTDRPTSALHPTTPPPLRPPTSGTASVSAYSSAHTSKHIPVPVVRGHSPCLSTPATFGWSGLDRPAGHPAAAFLCGCWTQDGTPSART